MNKPKSWFFEKNKIDKPLARLIKREDANKLRNQRKDITTKLTEIFFKIISKCNQQLYANKLDSLADMDKFQKYLPELIQEEIEHLNRSVTSKMNLISNEKPPNKTRWLH